MTIPAGREPVPELTTTRTGGGRSARFIALGVSAVLVAVVYLGVTGQKATPPTSDASPKPVAANALTIAQPSAAPAYPGPIVATGNSPAQPYFLGVGLTIGGQTAIAMLNQGTPHELFADFTVPTPLPDGDGTLDLRYVDNRAREQSRFATWSVPLDIFGSSYPQSVVLVDDTRAPDPIALIDSTSQPVNATGYRLVATGVTDESGSSLGVDLIVASEPTWPDETYQVSARVDGRHISSTSTVIRPGRIVGELLVDGGLLNRKLVVQIAATPAGAAHGKSVPVARYTVPIGLDVPPDVPIIEDTHPPAKQAAGLPGILTNGYQWQLFLSARGGNLIVSYQLVVNPTYDPTMFGAGRRL